jgi:hypothetical protein
MIQKKKGGDYFLSGFAKQTPNSQGSVSRRSRRPSRARKYASGSVDLCTLPQRLEPQLAFEELEEVRRQPVTLQNRPPTPFIPNYSCWGPPLSTSDPNYVPRRLISMSHSYREEAVRLNAHHTAESRVGAGSDGHGTSGGRCRVNQHSGN